MRPEIDEKNSLFNIIKLIRRFKILNKTFFHFFLNILFLMSKYSFCLQFRKMNERIINIFEKKIKFIIALIEEIMRILYRQKLNIILLILLFCNFFLIYFIQIFQYILNLMWFINFYYGYMLLKSCEKKL